MPTRLTSCPSEPAGADVYSHPSEHGERITDTLTPRRHDRRVRRREGGRRHLWRRRARWCCCSTAAARPATPGRALAKRSPTAGTERCALTPGATETRTGRPMATTRPRHRWPTWWRSPSTLANGRCWSGASMGGGTSLTAVGEGAVDALGAGAGGHCTRRSKRLGCARSANSWPKVPTGSHRSKRSPRPSPTTSRTANGLSNLDGLAKNVRLWPDGRYRWHWDPAFMHRPRSFAERIPRQQAAAENLTLPTLLVRGGMSDVLSEEGAPSRSSTRCLMPATPTSAARRTWWPATATTSSSRRRSISWPNLCLARSERA